MYDRERVTLYFYKHTVVYKLRFSRVLKCFVLCQINQRDRVNIDIGGKVFTNRFCSDTINIINLVDCKIYEHIVGGQVTLAETIVLSGSVNPVACKPLHHSSTCSHR